VVKGSQALNPKRPVAPYCNGEARAEFEFALPLPQGYPRLVLWAVPQQLLRCRGRDQKTVLATSTRAS